MTKKITKLKKCFRKFHKISKIIKKKVRSNSDPFPISTTTSDSLPTTFPTTHFQLGTASLKTKTNTEKVSIGYNNIIIKNRKISLN